MNPPPPRLVSVSPSCHNFRNFQAREAYTGGKERVFSCDPGWFSLVILGDGFFLNTTFVNFKVCFLLRKMMSEKESKDKVEVYTLEFPDSDNESSQSKFASTKIHSAPSLSITLDSSDTSSFSCRSQYIDEDSQSSETNYSTKQQTDNSEFKNNESSACPICYCQYNQLSLLNPCYREY